MVHVCCRRSLINVACAPSLSRHPGTSNRTCMFTMGPGPSSATSVTEGSASTPTSRITCSCTQVRTANTSTLCSLPFFGDCATSIRSGGVSYVYYFEKPLDVIRNSLLIGQQMEDVYTIGKCCDRTEMSYLFVYVTLIYYLYKLQMIGSKDCQHIAESVT